MADKAKKTGITTLELARLALRASLARAEELGLAMNVAVVDEGANLVAFERMDGAWLGSIDIAIDKAFTSRAFDMTTKALGKISQPEEPAFGISQTNAGRIVIFAGGVPLETPEGLVVGGIGASGGIPDQDEEVAKAGAEAFSKAFAAASAAKKRAA